MTFLQLLAHTPTWVWIIFIYILVKGFSTLRQRTVSLYPLLILPLVFAALSIHTIFILPLNFIRVGGFAFSSFIGIGVGFWQVSRLFIEVDRIKKRLLLPGSPMTLILMLAVFTLKYYIAYAQVATPEQLNNPLFLLSILMASGFCSGIFLGRAICYLCRFISLPHKDLSSAKQ